uniref:Uncharacterized protein n=1 Tax=Arion vulgaris TaxID=1028688 RepID=A0A0B6Y137_9EUPU
MSICLLAINQFSLKYVSDCQFDIDRRASTDVLLLNYQQHKPILLQEKLKIASFILNAILAVLIDIGSLKWLMV